VKPSKVFETEYYQQTYSKFLIDGDYNASHHADFIHTFFQLFPYKIKSVMDIGFGSGKFLKSVCKKFKPDRVIAIEASTLKTKELLQQKWIKKENIAIVNKKFLEIDLSYIQTLPLDLIICNSVLQYVQDADLFLNKISKIGRFVYFTAPTNKDFTFMKRTLNFSDEYAIQRSKANYLKLIKNHFRILGTNILESKSLMKDSLVQSELFQN
jgi:trans-aconitate methyltransferase